MKEIFSALARAQKNFEAALKGAQNPHFRSKYAALDACVEAVRGPLNDQGIFLTQTIETVESGVLIETLFAHESGETWQGGKLFMPVAKLDAQGYGSAITYGRRYSLLTACGVAPEDDDGNQAVVARPDVVVTPKKIINTPTQGAMDAIPPEERQYLQELALEAIAAVAAGTPRVAFDRIEADNLDSDQKTALWTLLDSKTRSAIKTAKVTQP